MITTWNHHFYGKSLTTITPNINQSHHHHTPYHHHHHCSPWSIIIMMAMMLIHHPSAHKSLPLPLTPSPLTSPLLCITTATTAVHHDPINCYHHFCHHNLHWTYPSPPLPPFIIMFIPNKQMTPNISPSSSLPFIPIMSQNLNGQPKPPSTQW